MKNLFLFFILFSVSLCYSQKTISGIITDPYNQPLPGATVVEKGTSNGTTTDFDGKYSIDTDSSDGVLVFSYVGFEDQQITIGSKTTVNITLEEGANLEEVVLVGTRSLPRSNTTTSLPVDVLPAKELAATGQTSFDKALQYKIPSFNTVQTPVNDATSLLDPYEIRNMGPSRTLILINGKRKNLSSLLYTQTSPGRGETGADISAISTDAIKRVEILRDGASAQYGSDAIAGVMNIILKDNDNKGSATFRSGVTSEGDGEFLGFSVNNGTSIGEDKGFFNYTIDLSKVNLANRPGTVNADGEFDDFVFVNPNNDDGTPKANAADIIQGNTDGRQAVEDFLATTPDAGNINGSPETAAAKFVLNGGYDISEETSFYMNAAYVYKKVNSFANYRTPYWRTEADFPYLADFFPNGPNGEYVGYLPTFEGTLNDYNGTLGFKTVKNGWNYDLSFTVGGNSQAYGVSNSHNRNVVLSPSTFVDANGNGVVDAGEITESSELYRENSPIVFNPGGTKFSHNVGNMDISKLLNDYISVGFGFEFRTETYEIVEGELASYDGGGADSFAGNRPENSGEFNRYNLGGYFDISADITEDFLVNGTVRAEDYSDFGEAFVWKLSGRYKFLDDRLTLRASASTGFRAPTLHQIFTQRAQFSFVPGQGIQVGGLINNVSPQAILLDVPKLDAEKSENITVGIGAKLNRNFNFTIDYYRIDVDDRIVLSTEIGGTSSGDTALDTVLNDNGLSDVSFFTNAIDTRTAGIDVVTNYKNIEIGAGKLGVNLSGNYTLENKRRGNVANPLLVEEAGQSVINDTQEALFFTSRPEYKAILGLNYNIGKFGFALNNTLFGPTNFKNQGLQDLENLFDEPELDALLDSIGSDRDQTINGGSDLGVELIAKVVTDFSVSFNPTEKLTLSINANNILNVLPEWGYKSLTETGDAVLNDPSKTRRATNLITFNGRYSQLTYDASQFSQLGTMFNFSLNYQF